MKPINPKLIGLGIIAFIIAFFVTFIGFTLHNQLPFAGAFIYELPLWMERFGSTFLIASVLLIGSAFIFKRADHLIVILSYTIGMAYQQFIVFPGAESGMPVYLLLEPFIIITLVYSIMYKLTNRHLN